MLWQENLKRDSLSWLLEPDPVNPSIRYFALRDLLDYPTDDPTLLDARKALMTTGTIPAILNAQHADGYWEKPGAGYGKYRATEWQILFLGDLGADGMDARVQRGIAYLLDHSLASNGGFAAAGNLPTPGGVIHCLNGNLLYALIHLGALDDPRVQGAIEWQVHAITGEPPVQYLKSATNGTDFACAMNAGLPCAWGAVKALKALAALPLSWRTPLIQRAIDQGVQLLLSADLVNADYPVSRSISASWFKLGFPLSYWSDVLEALDALVRLGFGANPKVQTAYAWLLSKQNESGRWALEHSLRSKMWINIERQGKPSKWITLRAMRVIKAIETS